ncbi:MAG: hypothetical protein WDZ83_18445 [Rhizobiaceae bacterium]
METILLSLAVLALSILGLSLGVIMGREPIRGSCGGVACIKGAQCASCGQREAAGAEQ